MRTTSNHGKDGGSAAGLCCLLLLFLSLGLPAPVQARQEVPDPPVSAEVRLGPGGVAILDITAREGELVPSGLRARAAEEGEGSGVQEFGNGGVHLHFRARPMDDVIPLLREMRERVDALPVLIRIPGDGSAGDVWVFQARLSQAGIRQVRIVSDPGDPWFPREPR
jgi:hypothetical protein